MKISIITVCSNSQATIAQTLESLATQCWPEMEHIIIDGASEDDTVNIINKHRIANSHLVRDRDDGIYGGCQFGKDKFLHTVLDRAGLV